MFHGKHFRRGFSQILVNRPPDTLLSWPTNPLPYPVQDRQLLLGYSHRDFFTHAEQATPASRAGQAAAKLLVKNPSKKLLDIYTNYAVGPLAMRSVAVFSVSETGQTTA
jgi:hypothetical protein